MNTLQSSSLSHISDQEKEAIGIALSIIRGSQYRTETNAQFAVQYASGKTQVPSVTIITLLECISWEVKKYLIYSESKK